MTSRVFKSKTLEVDEYFNRLDVNPIQSLYQTIKPEGTSSIFTADFTIDSPSRNSLLYPVAYLKLAVEFEHTLADGTAEAIRMDQDVVAVKDGMPLANAMRTCKLTINGATYTLPSSKVMRPLSMLVAGRKQSKNRFSTSGGEWDALDDKKYRTDQQYYGQDDVKPHFLSVGSSFNQSQENRPIFVKDNINVTNTAVAAAASMIGFMIPDSAYTKRQITEPVLSVGNSVMTVTFLEPLAIPPFNCFNDMKTPDWSFLQNMTNCIPHFNSAKLHIEWESDFAAAVLSYTNSAIAAGRIGPTYNADATGTRAAPANFVDLGIGTQRFRVRKITPELRLRWFKPPNSVTVKPEVSLQSWFPQVYTKPLSGDVAPGVRSEVILDYIELAQVPDLLVFYIGPKKNEPFYSAMPMFSESVREKWVYIDWIELKINTDSGALTRRVDSRDLYQMTLENCTDVDDFPYTYHEWARDRCFVALRPDQLGSFFMSPGVVYPGNISGTVSFRNSFKKTFGNHAAGGPPVAPSIGPVDKTQTIGAGPNYYRLTPYCIGYELTMIQFFGKHALTLTEDQARYSFQNLSAEQAASVIHRKQAGFEESGGSLVTGGSISTGGYKRRVA